MIRPTKSQVIWIEAGYNTFAYEGPGALRIERLAKQVGKNKSSFYHHFADLDVFSEVLLEHHLDQAQIIATKEAACKSLQELIDVVILHKADLLFNRQLRIHRENPDFEACFLETSKITVEAIIGLWAEILDLKDNSYLAGLVLNLSLENFYLQITDETMNQEWLENYFKEIKSLIVAFRNSAPVSKLDGTV